MFCVSGIVILMAANVHSLQSPQAASSMNESKAMYKSGEIMDQNAPITLDQIKLKLKDSGIFDYTQDFTDREKKELSRLFDAVEIMTSSRNRQPSSVQNNMFTSLRIVERAAKKQLKEHQISESLASKFNWDKLSMNTPQPSVNETSSLSSEADSTKITWKS